MSKSTLTIAETARALGISDHLVRKMVRTGEIPALKDDGKTIISRRFVEEFVNNGVQPEQVDVKQLMIDSQLALLESQRKALDIQISELKQRSLTTK